MIFLKCLFQTVMIDPSRNYFCTGFTCFLNYSTNLGAGRQYHLHTCLIFMHSSTFAFLPVMATVVFMKSGRMRSITNITVLQKFLGWFTKAFTIRVRVIKTGTILHPSNVLQKVNKECKWWIYSRFPLLVLCNLCGPFIL